MGRILTQVRLSNAMDPNMVVHFDGLVDTGAAQLVLPMAWKDRFGKMELIRESEVELGNQDTVRAEVYGPMKAKIGEFAPIFCDVMFIEMKPNQEGDYEPLVGYTVLELSGIAVDMLRHKLLNAKRIDCK
jgi:predicted aspartyl protease